MLRTGRDKEEAVPANISAVFKNRGFCAKERLGDDEKLRSFEAIKKEDSKLNTYMIRAMTAITGNFLGESLNFLMDISCFKF